MMVKQQLLMKRIEDFEVTGLTWLNNENYLLECCAATKLPEVLPGNFAEIRVDHTSEVFLRRPFSIYDVNHERNSISFYIKVIGKGTRILGNLKPGDNINIIYPLGNSFKLVNGKNVLVIGGGSGVAPFLLLGKKLRQENTNITFLIGGRAEKDILLTDTLAEYGDIQITTEDGSLGEKGMVTGHSIIENGLGAFDKIYTCGPDPMMKAVANIAKKNSIDCEASLENIMACGFGACLCCVVETTTGNLCVCTEGPVFNILDLAW